MVFCDFYIFGVYFKAILNPIQNLTNTKQKGEQRALAQKGKVTHRPRRDVKLLFNISTPWGKVLHSAAVHSVQNKYYDGLED